MVSSETNVECITCLAILYQRTLFIITAHERKARPSEGERNGKIQARIHVRPAMNMNQGLNDF